MVDGNNLLVFVVQAKVVFLLLGERKGRTCGLLGSLFGSRNANAQDGPGTERILHGIDYLRGDNKTHLGAVIYSHPEGQEKGSKRRTSRSVKFKSRVPGKYARNLFFKASPLSNDL